MPLMVASVSGVSGGSVGSVALTDRFQSPECDLGCQAPYHVGQRAKAEGAIGHTAVKGGSISGTQSFIFSDLGLSHVYFLPASL